LVEDWQRRLDEATFRGFLRGFLSGLRQAFEEDLVPGVTVPTLAIAAENDVIRVDRIQHMATRIPGARFALIRRASHMAPFSALETFREIVATLVGPGMLPGGVWEP